MISVILRFECHLTTTSGRRIQRPKKEKKSVHVEVLMIMALNLMKSKFFENHVYAA
jgi:hypothetical protein